LDASWLADEVVPGLAASVFDVLVGLVYAVGELVLAQICPDVFLRIELWAVGRQVQQADVVGDGYG
jgi:hypothetical protein